jgi:nucleolar protein 4
VIIPNSPAASTLTAIELEKRTNSFNARRALLRSNPALFVSKTRLSVRQIPLFVTERVLKRLAVHATRAFEAEVKEGHRATLTEDELYEPADQKEPEAKESKGKYYGRSTGVKQAKIVRQQERIDVVTGKGRSKGYGFVEMHTHADALRVLRWANNNQNLGGLFESWWKDELMDLLKVERDKKERDEMRLKRIDEERRGTKKAKDTLIVEFSIENAQVVHKRATHQKERESVFPLLCHLSLV